MAGPNVQLRFGNPKGVANVAAQIRSQVILRYAEATVERVQARVDHPAAAALTARPVNQWSADITGPRGGPGPIFPVRANVLRFEVAGQVVYARSVQGKGLGPLIEAEAQRVELPELNVNGVRVK